MTVLLRIVLIIVSLGTLWSLLHRIRKARLNIEEAISWVLMALMFVIFALFPVVPDTLAHLLGIYSTANFLFLLMIFLLFLRLFSLTMKVGRLEERVKELVQELALANAGNREPRKETKEPEVFEKTEEPGEGSV